MGVLWKNCGKEAAAPVDEIVENPATVLEVKIKTV
jgi:hypothetical protein